MECLNLDESGMTEQEIPDPIMVSRLKMSRLPFQVDRVISVPVMKTHMYAGVTLSIKNMKGCLFQKDQKPVSPPSTARRSSQGKMSGLWDCGFDESLLS